MKKTLILFLLALAVLFLGTAAAESESTILGKPFPDFTAADTLGNTFTLSEALKDHDAVLLNIWATWCPPCESEFPDLSEAYEKYGDRVAFIALSCEGSDTLEVIEEYRVTHGIPFAMGRDEGGELSDYTQAAGIPTTVIIDRFGNAAFLRIGAFSNADEISRLIEYFLRDSYTETSVLEAIPADASTRAFPVFAYRNYLLENENAKLVTFWFAEDPEPVTTYVVNDDTARLRLEIKASDDPTAVVYYDGLQNAILTFDHLLKPERNTYIYEQPMPGAQEKDHNTYGVILDLSIEDDPDGIMIYLISADEYIEEFADLLRSSGYTDVTWRVEETAPAVNPEPEAYALYVRDQYGAPVPGVFANFCTDTACTPCTSDENGVITFDGAPDVYHIQLLKVPDGYSFDKDFELYTGSTYGEWILRIRKD